MPENILEIVLEKIIVNWKKFWGCFLGFIIGTTIIKYGFINAVFIFIIAFIGYKLGDMTFTQKIKKKIIDKLKED